eukprot:augustus_masked-scaffold_1-processed-gene-32.51-mRNA-1 protein AED:1.00 eAED:1.00 QI:0/-1/0/0/-1/1/1/0/936
MENIVGENNNESKTVITSNFVPKFTNVYFHEKYVEGQDDEDHIYALSKKHSGHLVYGPPFYSKNATANVYSRVGAITLFNHFKSVYKVQNKKDPEKAAKELFSKWWKFSEEYSMCFCFECVVPKLTGEHGEIPKTAYMVLTAISVPDLSKNHPNTRRFLDHGEVSNISARFYLPLNEIWLIRGKDALKAVEKSIQVSRWAGLDTDTSYLIDNTLVKYPDSFVKQEFLIHSETQGETLEGFVIFELSPVPGDARMSLEKAFNKTKGLILQYNSVMKRFKKQSLEDGAALGRQFQTCSEDVINSMAPICYNDVYEEPLKIKRKEGMNPWRNLINWAGKATSPLLLSQLKWLKSKRAICFEYEYKGTRQYQIKGLGDWIFYRWEVERKNQDQSHDLFRGLVLSVQPEGYQVKSYISEPNLRIGSARKYKLVPYLFRTSVRNALPKLLNAKKSPTDCVKDFNQAVEKFFKVFHIPPVIRTILRPLYYQVENQATIHYAKYPYLGSGVYLDFLNEKVLKKTPFPFEALKKIGDTETSLTLPKKLLDVKFVFCVVGLPPGGGKSAYFEMLKSHQKVLGEDSVAIVSSDAHAGSNKRARFEESLSDALEYSTLIGYDKNIPDLKALQVLLDSLDKRTSSQDIRVVCTVPESIDRKLFFRRVKKRGKNHIGLAINNSTSGKPLTESQCYQIFSNFASYCEADLSVIQTIPGVSITEEFLNEKSGLEGLRSLINVQVRSMLSGDKQEYRGSSTSIRQLQDFLREAKSKKPPFQIAKYTERSSVSKISWAAFVLDKKSVSELYSNFAEQVDYSCFQKFEASIHLHMTIVPPIFTKDKDVKSTHKRCIQKLWSSRKSSDCSVFLTCSEYIISDRIKFWKVEPINLLPALEYPQQKGLYHITDRTSLRGKNKGVWAKEDLLSFLQQKKVFKSFKLQKAIKLTGKLVFY